MHYFSEIAKAWRPLLAAMLGLATGNSIVGVVTSAIVPSLIADAGWSKARFALIGSLSLATAVVLPGIGRLADVLGVRHTALIGLITVPLVYVAYSFCGGSLAVYAAIYVCQITICVTTSAMVYTRLVVRHVRRARGLALALVASSPALAGMVIGPVLSAYVEAHGWQASYRALAACVAVTGVATYLLIPADHPRGRRVLFARRGGGSGDYREMARAPALWILIGAMALCNLPGTLLLTQLKLLVMDHGIRGAQAAVMFTAMSGGMLAGRLVTGLALDRMAPHVVAFVAMAMPSLGLFLLGAPISDARAVGLAVFLLGFAFGAEGDAIAFLVARHFRIEIYSSVMGLITAVISASTALGAALLSTAIAATGGFALFLNATGMAVALGAGLLLLLGLCQPAPAPEA